jgi:hypothetical protein
VPHVKRYAEERELTVMLLVDASASTLLRSVRQTKSALAAELGALFAFSAITNNDKVGLVIFTDRIELALPPRKGTHHVLRVIREVLSVRRAGTGTDVAGALEHLARVDEAALRRLRRVRLPRPGCRAALAMARGGTTSSRSCSTIRARRSSRTSASSSSRRRRPASATSSTRGPARARRRSRARRRARAERDRMLRGADVDAIVVRTDRPVHRGAAPLLPHAGAAAVRRVLASCSLVGERRPRGRAVEVAGARRAGPGDDRDAVPLRRRGARRRRDRDRRRAADGADRRLRDRRLRREAAGRARRETVLARWYRLVGFEPGEHALPSPPVAAARAAS